MVARLCVTLVVVIVASSTLTAASLGQEFIGVGAAMTRSSAALLMRDCDAATRARIVHALVRDAGVGALRVPMGSSDFTPPLQDTRYTYNDLPADAAPDWNQTHFSVDKDLEVGLPDALRLIANASAPRQLFIIAAPWSAPAWMKTTGSLNGGTLRANDGANGTRVLQSYALYFARFVEAYAALGIHIDAVTPQNEPRNSNSGYPTMTLTPQQEADLVLAIDAVFTARNLSTRVVVYDHNWDDPAYPIAVYTALRNASSSGRVPPRVLGAAFHCYAGNVAAQSAVHDFDPALDVFFTECSGTATYPDFVGDLLWDAENLIVGATRSWARTVLKWNVLLDAAGGPKLPGGCSNCRGVVTVNATSGHVTLNEDFYALAHLGRFVPRGSRRALSPGNASASNDVWFATSNGTVGITFNTAATAVYWNVSAPSQGHHHAQLAIPGRSVVTAVVLAGAAALQWWVTNATARLAAQTPVPFM